jgi:trimeric autotransporter adhesin
LYRYLFAFLVLPVVSLAQVTDYVINTIIGSSAATVLGDAGPANAAELSNPIGLYFDASHNLFIADSGFNRVREVTGGTGTGTINTVAGDGTPAWMGDGGLATSANLYAPFKAITDSSGNVYIADVSNQVIRLVTKSSGDITTFAGNNCCYGFNGDGSPATNVYLNHPVGMAFDTHGNLYFADSNNHRIRMISPGGTVTTVAGNGNQGYSGDGGPAINAQLNEPFGIAFDAHGNLYFADSHNNRIRVLLTNGNITTVAGNGKAGYSGDMIAATTAELNQPFDVAFDQYGNLYIADANNYRIRKVTTAGTIYTIGGGTGEGYSGDGYIGTNAKLNSPSGVIVDSSNNVYIADSGNNVIRELTPYVPIVNAGGVLSASSFGGFPSAAPGSWIEIYGSDMSFSARSWTGADFTGNGLIAPTSLDGVSVTVGGQAAYVDYISATQINVQIPYTVAPGQQAVIVKDAAGASIENVSVTINPVQPGMFAPPAFIVGGTQYAGALFSDGATYALPPGAVSGITSRRANPGDLITFYGVGFGPVTPNIPAGQVVQQLDGTGLPSFQLSIEGTAAQVQYAGLAPNAIGLYQFNVYVPNVPASDTAAVTFTVGGVKGTQNLHIAVQ